jgi:hypothetical protein
MEWNIELGANLNGIADQIRQQNPTVVLLNEVGEGRQPNPLAHEDQTATLAAMTGYPFYQLQRTVATALTGWKVVPVLSRYQLTPSVYHPVIVNGSTTAFGTIETTFTVNGLIHHMFSTRFAPHQNSGRACH